MTERVHNCGRQEVLQLSAACQHDALLFNVLLGRGEYRTQADTSDSSIPRMHWLDDTLRVSAASQHEMKDFYISYFSTLERYNRGGTVLQPV